MVNRTRRFSASVFLVIVVILVIIFTGLGSYYTIDQGEKGVILRYGAIKGTADPGFILKSPVQMK